MSWFNQFQPASYNGVPFAVRLLEGDAGRRQALHQYPKRDTPWPEDMGRKMRGFQITGFLIGDDVGQQRDQMLAAVETAGPGQLVHPSMGLLKVAITDFRHIERHDRGRYIELQFSFVEAGQRLFPTAITATQPAVLSAATGMDGAASSDFAASAASTLKLGAQIAEQAATTVGTWTRIALGLANDATSLTNMVSSLSGDYGRYFNGGNIGAFGVNTTPTVNSAENVDSLILAGSQAQVAINTAATTVSTSATNLSLTTSTTFAAAVQALAAALLAAIVNPADGIRLLANLANFTPNQAIPSSSLGTAMSTMQTATGNLCRRAAVTALARVVQNYQPTSYNDAANVRNQVTLLLDNEITLAGDNGEDASYDALCTLRSAVVDDLTARGANLAPIATFTFGASLPALVLATRLYRDPSREEELVIQANPIHPSFMPVTFQALAE